MVRTAAVLVSLVGLVAAAAARPAARQCPRIRLTERTASAIPHCAGCAHVGEGRFVIESPDSATVVIHMIGAVVATAHPKGSAADLDFLLTQEFDIVGGLPAGTAKLSLETSLIGVLRGGRIAAATADAGATVFRDGNEIVTAETPDRARRLRAKPFGERPRRSRRCARQPGPFSLARPLPIGGDPSGQPPGQGGIGRVRAGAGPGPDLGRRPARPLPRRRQEGFRFPRDPAGFFRFGPVECLP